VAQAPKTTRTRRAPAKAASVRSISKRATAPQTAARKPRGGASSRGGRGVTRSGGKANAGSKTLRMQIQVPVSKRLPSSRVKLVETNVRRYGETIGREAGALQDLPRPAFDQVLKEATEAAHASMERAHFAGGDTLSAQARQALEETTRAWSRLFADLAEQLSAAQLREQMRVALDTTRALVSGRPRVFEALTRVLSQARDLDEARVETLNEARLLALHNRVREDSHVVKDLEKWGLVRQRLHQLRQEDRIFAIKVPQERGLLYPEWQFDPESHRERAGVPELISTAKEAGIDPLSFHLLMTNPEAGDGTAPVEMLESGDIDAAQAILRANAV
jgi:hypothetical protein